MNDRAAPGGVPLVAPLVSPLVAPLGDDAVLVRLGTAVDPALARRVRHFAAHLRRAALPGVREVVSSYAALALHLDHAGAQPAVLAAVRELAAALTDSDAAPDVGEPDDAVLREHAIPVRYDGPDLAEVARRCALTTDEVVRRHAATAYEAFAIGFVPGFAYLGTLDESLRLPRRDQPRPRVTPGSVAIAGAQTAVYPLPSPGGWHLIGRTEVPFFDPDGEPPALVAVGDRVRFVPVEG